MSNKLERHNCPECGHANANERESIDLWTLCEEYDSHLITDAQVIAWDEAEEAEAKAD